MWVLRVPPGPPGLLCQSPWVNTPQGPVPRFQQLNNQFRQNSRISKSHSRPTPPVTLTPRYSKSPRVRWAPAFPNPPEHSARASFHCLLNWGEEDPHAKLSFQPWAPRARLEAQAGRPDSESPGKASKTSLNHNPTLRAPELPLRRPQVLWELQEGGAASEGGKSA